ncbi:siderophore-interacting protein [Leucobacter albus]|uniref:Siderophore-interacting protein n=1 Tax=Leucobacter albus TaxID=272210 RepID=A0ABW3TIU2_9MICO
MNTPAEQTPETGKSQLITSKATQSDDHNRGLQLGSATVLSFADITPELARVVLQIPDLPAEPLWSAPNVAIRFYLDERFESATRVYTVRSANVAESSIEVDVVKHGESSPMMQWLDTLRVGDALKFGGPRPHFDIPRAEGRDAVIFADATSIPALYAILEQAEPGLSGRGWIATHDEGAFAELPVLPGLNLTRIAPGTGFTDQLATLADPASVVVWGAGERDEMRAVRSFFRNEHGLAKDDVAVFGYWKRGTTNTQIDVQRVKAYEIALAEGRSVHDLDDLALAI